MRNTCFSKKIYETDDCFALETDNENKKELFWLN